MEFVGKTAIVTGGASGLDSQAAARLESEYQNKCANSENAAPAIKAFITKTKAVFKGR